MNDEADSFQPIGLIGLGLVGSGLAIRMKQAGFSVLGFDIDHHQCQKNQEAGIQIAESLSDIAQQCSRVVLSLPDSNIVEKALLDKNGLLRDTSISRIIVDTTTGNPPQVRQISKEVSQRNSMYCDACLIGSSTMIQEGDCVVVIGGQQEVFETIQDLLDSWTNQIFHMGDVGTGSDAKLVVNLVIGLNRLVLSESLVFAESLGLDLCKILDVLKSGVSYSKVMDTKGKKMIERDFNPQARLRQHLKDVTLINALGLEHNVQLPLSNLHESILNKGIEMDLGDLDNSAVIEILKRCK